MSGNVGYRSSKKRLVRPEKRIWVEQKRIGNSRCVKGLILWQHSAQIVFLAFGTKYLCTTFCDLKFVNIFGPGTVLYAVSKRLFLHWLNFESGSQCWNPWRVAETICYCQALSSHNIWGNLHVAVFSTEINSHSSGEFHHFEICLFSKFKNFFLEKMNACLFAV